MTRLYHATMRFLSFLLDALYPVGESAASIDRLTDAQIDRLYAPQRFTGTLQVSCCMSYASPLVQTLIREAKFSGNEHAQRILGCILARFIREEILAEERGTVALVPIPLSVARSHERGYNQTARISTYACTYVPELSYLPHALTRMRETAPQTSLGRADRLLNVRGAFSATQDLHPAYLYIVVDDVVTTGATLRAAYKAFSDAGITRILPIALAS